MKRLNVMEGEAHVMPIKNVLKKIVSVVEKLLLAHLLVHMLIDEWVILAEFNEIISKLLNATLSINQILDAILIDHCCLIAISLLQHLPNSLSMYMVLESLG